MQNESHKKVTGFSGNEIFCLNKLGFTAGQLCIGNEVVAIGALGIASSTLANIAGGEITKVTDLVHRGRQAAFLRMMEEVRAAGGVGLAGVSFDMINHGGNLEFISLGSVVHNETMQSSSAFFQHRVVARTYMLKLMQALLRTILFLEMSHIRLVWVEVSKD
jgi:uncharacterized protein YbjQ (UPF0145 family)